MAVINVKRGMNPVSGTLGNDEINLQEVVGNGIVINAEAGNDVITVTRGDNHTINAGAGVDFVTVASGKNYKINLGEGNDRVDLLGAEGHQVVAVAGTNNINVNNGSSYVITGGTGIDRLTIKGTNSNIKADLGAGEDVLGMATGSGNEIHGGADKDYFIISGGDTSTFYGDDGNDTLRLYRGNGHTLYAGAGDDSMLVTEANNSKVYGVSGKNQIMFFGGTGNEYHGGDEKDNITLKNKAEAVKVYGGTKNTVVNIQVGDKHVIDLSKSTNTVTQIMAGHDTTMTGGTGKDTLKIWGSTYGLWADLGDGNDLLNVKNGTNMYLSCGAGNDELQILDGVKNSFDGGAGDDKISISGGSDSFVSAGEGNDIITITGGNNYEINAYTGKDTIKVRNGENFKITALGEENTLDISGGKKIEAQISGKNNTITLSGGSDHVISAGKEGDTVKFTGTVSDSAVKLGDGNNTIWINGGQDNTVNTKNGSNTILIEAGDSINYDITTGQGDDFVSIMGGTYHHVSTGGGKDGVMVATPMDVNAHTLINTGDGIDSVMITGNGYTIHTVSDDDIVAILGEVKNTSIDLGMGNDYLGVIGVAAEVSNLKVDGSVGNDNIELDCYVENSNIRSSSGENNILVGNSEAKQGQHNTIYGGFDADTIKCVNNQYALIDGGQGSDIIECFQVKNSVIAGGTPYSGANDTFILTSVSNSFIDGGDLENGVSKEYNNTKNMVGKKNIQFLGYNDKDILYVGGGENSRVEVLGSLTNSKVIAGYNPCAYEISSDMCQYNIFYGANFGGSITINKGNHNTFYARSMSTKCYINGGFDNLIYATGEQPVNFYITGKQGFNYIRGSIKKDTFNVSYDAKAIINAMEHELYPDSINVVGTTLDQMDIKVDKTHHILKLNDIYIRMDDSNRIDIYEGSYEMNNSGLKVNNSDLMDLKIGKTHIYADLQRELDLLVLNMGEQGKSVRASAFENELDQVYKGVSDRAGKALEVFGNIV